MNLRGESLFMKRIIIVLPVVFILTACITEERTPIEGNMPTRRAAIVEVDAAADEPIPIPVAVLHKTANINRGIYEPTEGIYLGAWLAPHYNLRDFSEDAGRSHAVFVHEMDLDGEIPINWVLQCIASLAMPLLVVHPPVAQDYDIPIGNYIAYLAQRVGAFNLPMFVAFYPPGHGMGAPEYAVLFRQARALFLQHAPQVAFVWVAPSVESTHRNPFFPGSDAVDWIAVSLFAGRNAYGFSTDVIEAFEPFYRNFESLHPIMILPLGVSHFSRYDHAYHIPEAAAEILRIYRELASFPRVGLVAYGDIFGIAQTIGDDFSITLEDGLMQAYRDAVANEHFIATPTTTQGNAGWVRSEFIGYYYDGRIYIDVRTLAERDITVPRVTVEIEEETFVDAQLLTEVQFCEIRGVVTLE